MTDATCYVCAHLGHTSFGSTLPSGSPAAATDSLGVCYSCSVLACSEHATRGGQYQCVICQHSAAVIFASVRSAPGAAAGGGAAARILAASPAGAAAAAEAFARGANGPRSALMSMRRALDRLQRDALQLGPDDRHGVAETPSYPPFLSDEPNIVADLKAVVLGEQRRRGIVGEGVPRAVAGLSLAAIGAAARETLFPLGAETSFGANAAQVAFGALVGALSVADEQPGTAAALPAPWEVAHPGLLDPVMWLIGTAYVSASAAPDIA